MSVLILALLIGVVAGLRTMTAPAAIAWAACQNWLPVQGGWAGFLHPRIVAIILTVLALVELVSDQLPKTPSRKAPIPFGARIVSGGFCGAVIGTAGDTLVGGLVAGVVGAVIGTLGGYELRMRVAKTIGRDWPAALLEDAIAMLAAFWIVFPHQ